MSKMLSRNSVKRPGHVKRGLGYHYGGRRGTTLLLMIELYTRPSGAPHWPTRWIYIYIAHRSLPPQFISQFIPMGILRTRIMKCKQGPALASALIKYFRKCCYRNVFLQNVNYSNAFFFFRPMKSSTGVIPGEGIVKFEFIKVLDQFFSFHS